MVDASGDFGLRSATCSKDGQGQSSSSDVPNNDAPVKQDYYDLLGVERTATDDELKKAYRRKALELHPDRNYGDEEGATRLFADVQSAYEILSDPQERAWYDSHRDVLLRGEQPGAAGSEDYSYNMKLTGADEVLKLMMRFNKNVQYTDSSSGFFGGLNDFFVQLAKEEDIACQWQDLDFLDYPQFGSKNDDYEELVRPFYGAWSGFATKKSYSWKDQYRLSDAPDRRIRRLMEKENQKLRDEAIAEFNDAVRSIVAFVRKRDPRVENNQKSEAERQKILRESAAAQSARMRAQRQQEMEKQGGVSSWAQSASKDENEGGFSSESDLEQHEHDCVVCDKTFKSEQQYRAHEKSKKHIKLLKDLKREMRREGKELDLEPETLEVKPTNGHTDHEPKRNTADRNENGEADSRIRTPSIPSDDELSVHESDINKITSNLSPPTKARPHPANEDDLESQSEDDDYATRSTVVDRIAGDGSPTITDATSNLSLHATPAESGTEQSTPKLNKAKQKRAKKEAKEAAPTKGGLPDLACIVCAEVFTSRNKLFDHIKDTDHTPAFLNEGQGKSGKSKKKKK